MAGKGIVVDHKESGVRYAISESNFREATHDYVRDLKPGETVINFKPKPRGFQEDEPEEQPATVESLVADYTLDELKDLAKDNGLPVSGTKTELAQSLMDLWTQAEDEGDSTPE